MGLFTQMGTTAPSQIVVAGYTFTGPRTEALREFLPEESGVYVVLRCGRHGYEVLDVGESDKIGTRLPNHDRYICWMDYVPAPGTLNLPLVSGLWFAYLLMPGSTAAERRSVESVIRLAINPPCGER